MNQLRLVLGALALLAVFAAGCGGPTNLNTNRNNTMEDISTSFGQAKALADTPVSSFWNLQALKTTPKVETVSESVEKSPAGDVAISEIRYDSPASGGETIKVFAYYGYPAEKRNMRLPAIVWVHGGGSVGSKQAVIEWASRGYAAISMDLPGKGGDARASSRSEGPDMSDARIFTITPSPKESYLYLCVNAVCRAVSVVASRKEVDPARIGVLGYSWGGVITLLVNGIDDRIAAACTVYGAGFIPDESYWVKPNTSAMAPREVRLWREHFDPSSYLHTQHGKTLFLSATQDAYYPLRSFAKTYEGAACEKALGLALNTNHELDDRSAGCIARWFEWALKSGPGFPTLKTAREGDKIKVTARGPRPIISASLVTADGTDFAKAKWTAAEMSFKNGAWTAPAPKPGAPYFMMVKDDNGAAVAGDLHLPNVK